MTDTLDVMLWGRKAGTLVAVRDGYRTRVCFYFDRDFARSGYDIAPLRSPVSGTVAQQRLPVYPEEEKSFGGLPSFIADSLPDKWGNTVFAEWAKSRNIRMRDLTPLDRLAYTGKRGMGALEFVPPTAADMERPFQVDIDELSQLSRRALDEAAGFHADLLADIAIESLFRVGTSAGGRRPKAVVNVNLERGDCYSGQVAAPQPGYTPMIVKFDEHTDVPSTRIEYSYYLMARTAGVPMMPCRLLSGEGGTHFLTERFDRSGDEKIHVQTFAAVMPGADSYEELFDAACRIGVSQQELQSLFRMLVMNVVGGNVDDHNKNFSFLMRRDGVWHTSPCYDYTFSVDPDAPAYVNRHSLSVGGKVEGIRRSDLVAAAERYGIRGADAYVERACGVARDYRSYAQLAGVPERWTRIIEEEIAVRTAALCQ